MKNYSPDVLDLLDQGRIVVRGMIRFDFGTGTYGFIRSDEPLTYNGLTYVPGGLIQVSELTSGISLSAAQFTITLAASPYVSNEASDAGYGAPGPPVTGKHWEYVVRDNEQVTRDGVPVIVQTANGPDEGLTPAVLRTIEAEDYRDRPVTIYDAQFHPDTNELLSIEVMRRGYVDVIRHIRDTRDGYMIIADCETRAIDYTRKNGRKRSNLDQQRRAPNDKWFEHASLRGREIVVWGREATPANVINSGGSGGPGKFGNG